ncbi:VOC family protein [Jiangella gansuensis]|uniref:VOC family protein n=1 Tax=Jiangella gansuensis TaxID=281473 RepID=UPI00047C6FA4|nr:VOC family protein [Jiangella gansuensis]
MGEDRSALSRPDASAAVSHLGWRYLLGRLHTGVAVGSLAEAAEVATTAAQAAGTSASLSLDLRRDRVLLAVQDPAIADVTPADVETAGRITTALLAAGRHSDPGLGEGGRVVQSLEIGIDAIDIPAIRPFWKAVLGYTDEPGHEGPEDPLVDPRGQGPAVWFQQMDAPRPQRNRIHLDVTVPHDEAENRLRAALAAGGRLVFDAMVPAFWVLADPEGNEACICTWQGRD